MPARPRWFSFVHPVSLFLMLALIPSAEAGTGVHTTYLWHMHQPIYWPDQSGWNPGRYETAYETITLGHSQNDVFTIFNKDDRVADYQNYPKDAVSSVLDLPDAGAQVSFAGALIENITSLGDAGWNGGRYASNWYSHYRTAMGWSTSRGQRRLDPVLVGFHHAIGPLMDEAAFRMELACAREIWNDAWGPGTVSAGFFPAEMCFSERLIPALVDAGVTWSVVPDLHIGRACENYPYQANLDNCDPPNRADQVNPSQTDWTSHTISRGVTLKVPYPFGFTPHRAEYVDPATGVVSNIIVVPAANAMGWEEGYGLFGTGGIDAIAAANNPAQPMLVLFAHDGDNAWSGGYSYYNENVTQFSHAAAGQGYTPTTVATYLDEFPVPAGDVVHVEDGGWVNADGDFGSPQYINWNWPLVSESGAFDIPGGWAEDERNWAVLTAAQNRVETVAAIVGTVDPAKVVDPSSGANDAERAWHYLLAGYESGYMYYGTSLDMEIKATLACNQAVAVADPVITGGTDTTEPTVWLPQRLPWNPGGFGGGALWGWPSGDGAAMTRDFHVWTFAHDVSGLARVELMVREDDDGANDPATHVNETYAGGAGVGAWTAVPMNHRVMPLDEPWDMPGVDFTVLPTHIADQYWVELTGYQDVLLDYYIEAEDGLGHIKRSPVQHVYVGTGDTGGGGDSPFVMDGGLDADVPSLASSGGVSLWGDVRDGWLYLASDAPAVLAGNDVFLMINEDTTGTRAAPWAKAGSAVPWTRFLAREADNGWTGWFDGVETLIENQDHALGSGAVLEGAVRLDAVFPAGWPAAVHVCAAAYLTGDGQPLQAQVPSGDGDGDLELPEYVEIALAVSAVPQPGVSGAELSAWPIPFNARVNLRLSGVDDGPADIHIHDAAGRLVRRLSGTVVSGVMERPWDGRDGGGRNLPSGIYFARVVGEAGPVTVRLVQVK
ncbi:MAG: FlgD immunoglobulin-like domain containing protein [Candidatus Krumholzibacteriota bacterium]